MGPNESPVLVRRSRPPFTQARMKWRIPHGVEDLHGARVVVEQETYIENQLAVDRRERGKKKNEDHPSQNGF